MNRYEANEKYIRLIRQGVMPNDKRFEELAPFVNLEEIAAEIGVKIPKWGEWDADAYFDNYLKKQENK